MKKIVSLTLVAAMLLSFAVLTSCNQKSAYEQVSEAITNTLALDDLNVVVDEVATQSVAGQSQKAESNFEMNIKGFNSSSPEHSTALSVKTGGVTVDMSVYFKDNIFYLEAAGQKTKQESGEATASYDMVKLLRKMVRQIPEESFGDAKLNDGKIELNIAPEKFATVFEEYVDASIVNFNSMIKEDSMKIEEATVSIEIKDGYVVTYNIDYTMTLTLASGSTEMELDINCVDKLTVKNPGKAVTITPPADLDSYKG